MENVRCLKLTDISQKFALDKKTMDCFAVIAHLSLLSPSEVHRDEKINGVWLGDQEKNLHAKIQGINGQSGAFPWPWDRRRYVPQDCPVSENAVYNMNSLILLRNRFMRHVQHFFFPDHGPLRVLAKANAPRTQKR